MGRPYETAGKQGGFKPESLTAMSVPGELVDQQLLFDHALCHALWCRKKDVPDAVPGWSIEDLVDYHWLLQAEMDRRGFIHKTYDDLDGVTVGKSTVQSLKSTVSQINAKSVYLAPPHARMIWNGEKSLTVKCRNYSGMLNKPLYWADDEYVYGVLKFTDIEPITLEQFKKLQPQHKISDKERTRWWPDANMLYAYTLKILNRFKTPQSYKYQRGVQVFFPTPEWKSDTQDLTIAVDLDGTIADTDTNLPIPECYTQAKPKTLAQESMKDLNDLANIVIYTARDPRYYELTAGWLDKNGISYDELILGKPVADMYIDDLGVNFCDNWRDVVGVAHAAAEMFSEEKQTPESAGPGGETAVEMHPTTYQEAVRTVHSPEQIGKSDLIVEDGQLIAKASLPKANKPATRYYDVKKLPSLLRRFANVLVQQKFDGMDMMLSKEKVWSGRGLDKTSRVPHIIEELKNWPHESFILHGQAMMYSDSQPMHRTLAIGYLNGEAPVEEGRNLRIWIFDIIELDGKSLADMPMIDRLKLLRKEFKGTVHLPIIKPEQFTVVPPSKTAEAAERMGNLKGSEGAMLFDAQSQWNTKRIINFGWAKWKKQKEIDVLVVKKERKQEGWRYLGAIGPINDAQAKTLPANRIAEMKGKKWLIMGHTHVSGVEAAEGDILRVRCLEIVKNNSYDYTYQNAVPMYQPEKNVPDGLDTAEELASQTLQKADDVAGYLHMLAPISPGRSLPTPEEITQFKKASDYIEKRANRQKCMRCEDPPTVDVLYAEGMGRAWFCDKDFEEWKQEPGGPWEKEDPEYDAAYTHEKDICKVYKVTDGEVPVHWKEHSQQHDEKVQKQFASDPDSGSQQFEPGRLDQGIMTTTTKPEPSADSTGPEGSAGITKIKDVDTYDPAKIDDRVLLDDHRITHAWWSTLQSGKPLVHDKPTVKALHDAIAREIEKRGMNHNTPLEKEELTKANGGFTYAPGGVIGVPGMGGGERVPDPADNTFHEITPLQYMRADETSLTSHVFFKGPEGYAKAQQWKAQVENLFESIGISNYKISVDEEADGWVATVRASATDPEKLKERIDTLQKQLWPPWTGHRADPKTGKPLSSEKPPVNPTEKQMPPEESTRQGPVTWTPSRGAAADAVELATWNLRFLGTSGEKTFPRKDCDDEQCRTDKRLNASAIFENSGTNVLLDCGSKELAEKVQTRLDAVCVTHAHPDHIDGLEFLSEDVPIYMHRSIWRDIREQRPEYAEKLSHRELHFYSSYNAIRIGNVKVRWLPVKHSLKVQTFAIRINGIVLYSPDCLEISDKWLGGVETWIIDGASLTRDIVREQDGEDYGHQSILNSLKQAKKNGVPQVIITHVGHLGVKQEDMPEALSKIALEAEYDKPVLAAHDGFVLPGGLKKAAEPQLPETKEGNPYPAQFYKGAEWLHGKAFTFIVHHHFPYGPKINKEKRIEPDTAGDIKITGSPPSSAGGNPPGDAISAPRDPSSAERYVWEQLKPDLAKSEEPDIEFGDSEPEEIRKGVGGFREHWETRQDTGDAKSMIGWTFLTYPWEKTQRFFSGSIKGMTTAKPAIPKQSSKKFPRGWLDVQGLRKPVLLGGEGSAAETNRCGFYEILEEGTFKYGVQRNNLHEYFFYGKLLRGRWIFRLLKLASGSPRWLAFRPSDQQPMDPIKHEDDGHYRLAGETEAPVQSPGEEKKPIEG